LSEPLIALFGPTAVGKTEIAVALAELLRERGERPVAVSVDAYQVYDGLDALTAKPEPEEQERLEHRLISFVPLEDEFSVAQFAARAQAEIDELLAAGRRVLVVGGAGLYLRAALSELDLKPPPEHTLRAELEREVAALGPEALHDRLSAPVAAEVHPQDRKRIVRALELELMGEGVHAGSEQLWSEELRRPAILFGLVMERERLDARIGGRVEKMLGAGAADEVERALARGASRTARKAIGFNELAAHLAGQAELEEVAARLERRHRQYARRQLTWMRKLPGVELLDRTALSGEEAAQELLRRLDSLPAP
jgi:tRNA dimethylallyltransferase